MSLEEREEIAAGLAAGESLRMIARRLGRAPSTISREVNHRGGPASYRASRADKAAWDAAKRPKPSKLAERDWLRDAVEDKLRLRWAPEQIAGWLRDEHPDDPEWWVSHETIYRSLFVQSKGALKHELTGYLRTKRVMRRPAGTSRRKAPAIGRLKDTISIRERPAEAEDRAVPGHWEGDLIRGTRGVGDRDAGGTQHPVRDAGQGHGGRRRDRVRRSAATSSTCPRSCAGR